MVDHYFADKEATIMLYYILYIRTIYNIYIENQPKMVNSSNQNIVIFLAIKAPRNLSPKTLSSLDQVNFMKKRDFKIHWTESQNFMDPRFTKPLVIVKFND